MANKGLGRGLDSLFSAFDEPEEEILHPTPTASNEEHSDDIVPREIPIALIDRNTSQPRRVFDEGALAELAQSIKTPGVIQPIILVKKNDRYMIVSGERRWRASKIAGLKTIPAIVRRYTEAEIAEIALIENLQREDLNPIESALAIKELIDKFNLTQEQISEKIGKSRSAVANTLRLLALAPDVIKLIQSGELSAGHGKVLVSISDPDEQIRVAKMVAESKSSVRELEKYIQNLNETKVKHRRANYVQSLELQDFSRRIQDKFATKTTIQGSDHRGKIIIEYFSKDDLDRIFNIINR